jgi:hypothetical protein
MQKQQEAQQGHVVLDIGGYRYPTSLQTLRRLPGTFFDAYFSGRYTMGRSEDGSIFIDRDGRHFGQVLDYLRDGVVSVAEQDPAELDVCELRWLRREFGFYCIELSVEPQDMAFAIGGSSSRGGQTLACVERYDVASGAWLEAAPMATARRNFGSCVLSDGQLYVIGGLSANDDILATVERYDPSLGIWNAAPALPQPRWAHCACVVCDVMYVLCGNMEVEGRADIGVSSVLMFDTQAQIWSEMAPMPTSREYAGACVLGSDIYIFGGIDDDEENTCTTYCFSTETNEWTTLAPMPEAKIFFGVSTLRGLIHLIGGKGDGGDVLSSVHRFDPVANSWSVMADLCVGRVGPEAFVLDGSIYVVGGRIDDENTRLTSMERYCATTDRWTPVIGGDLVRGRSGFGVLVTREEVGLFDSLITKAQSNR